MSTPAWGLLTLLHPNSPNPFLGQTSIPFTLGAAGPVKLTIYDVSGRLVRTVLNEPLPAGDHSVTWDGVVNSASPNGVYFYRLQVGDLTQTRKMVMMPSTR